MPAQPKYLYVADTLRREIAEGVFRDGQTLLTEEELRIRFGVSRQTIRQAIALLEDDATADIKVGIGVKSEGEMIVSGTRGYVYVPAPWWKTDYFEIRYEDPKENKRCFFQLDGEGIRYEVATFLTAVSDRFVANGISRDVTLGICSMIEDFNSKTDLEEIVI